MLSMNASRISVASSMNETESSIMNESMFSMNASRVSVNVSETNVTNESNIYVDSEEEIWKKTCPSQRMSPILTVREARGVFRQGNPGPKGGRVCETISVAFGTIVGSAVFNVLLVISRHLTETFIAHIYSLYSLLFFICILL